MVGEKGFIDALQVGNIAVDGDIKGKTHVSSDGNDNYMRLDFNSTPIYKGKVLADGTTLAHAAPTGATGDENVALWPEGSLEWHVLGTQTILASIMNGAGLNVEQDAADDDGAEYCPGILASHKCAFVVGTAQAFFARLRFLITDVSITDDCAFGFRKVEAYQANIDDYDEMAALNVISGNITIETILNAGATTVTDTTNDWADAAAHELMIKVSDAGVVTYSIDGLPPTTTAAFTFDDGEVVVPFFYFLHASAAAVGIVLKEFECGLQEVI